MEFRSFIAIQGNRSPSLYKSQCIESWNSENAEWKSNHTLQCGCFKHRTLVPNLSFCESAQSLRSSFEFVGAVRFDSGREGTRKNSRKKRETVKKTKERNFTRSELFGVFSKTGIWKQFAEKTIRTSNHCPRLFNSQRFVNTHRSGTGYRLV